MSSTDRLITSDSTRRIVAGNRVRLHFSVLLESGEEVDTTRRGRPATFCLGDGNLLEGFEKALIGMKKGDDAQILLEPEAAFGLHRQENIQLLEVDRFGSDISLEEGLMVSFDGPGGELPGVVRRIMEKYVEVDFNHPLAGHRIIFDVSILAVEDQAIEDVLGDRQPGERQEQSSD